MFSKFSTILQQAVDVLAPDTTPLEDFQYHWKAVTNFYVENTDDKCPVTDSNIPSHLEQMLQILIQEESERSVGDTGPCMEYLLQHKLLETLHTLGRADCPPGMKQQVLIFFTKILGKIQQPLLPHINVHRPVSRLVRVCGEVAAAPTEAEEIAFLCTVCSRLKREPHLAHLFLRNTDPYTNQKKGRKSENAATTNTENSNANTNSDTKTENLKENKNRSPTHTEAYSTKREGYDLVDSLLNLSKSADGRVAVKSCEGMMLLVSLRHEVAAKTITKDTALCALLNNRLESLFTALPSAMLPSDIQLVDARWGMDPHGNSGNDAVKFQGKRPLLSFLSWFDYCDKLVSETFTEECRQHIADSIADTFLSKTVLPLLLQTNERTLLTSTALLTKLFAMVESKTLLHSMILRLLQHSQSEKDETSLLMRLLERCNHVSDEIVIVTLHLFEIILSRPDQTAFDVLVVDYLIQKGFHARNPGNIEVQLETTELEWDLEPGLDSGASHDTSTSDEALNCVTQEFSSNPRIRIQQAVNCYLICVPDTAKSSIQDDGSGHDSYLREAHRMFKEVSAMCAGFKWPDTYKPPEACQTVQTFNEGPFMRMLLSKLSCILDQPYDVNLVVTSLASRLCLLSNSLVHDYFCDPLTPLRPGVYNLYATLQKASQELQSRMNRIPNFVSKLQQARKALVGPNDGKYNVNAGGVQSSLTSPPSSQMNDHQTLLEGAIVLEEFCKELAAIIFVKYHAGHSNT